MLPVLVSGLLAMVGAAEVPAARYERMHRGINLTGMWSDPSEASLERISSWARREDYDQLVVSGFRHVRIPVNPEALWGGQTPVALDKRKMDALRSQVSELLKRQIAVILAFSPAGFKKPLARAEKEVERYEAFLAKVAPDLRAFDPNWVFIEIIDAPQAEEPARWREMLASMAENLRPLLPDHTFIVSGPGDTVDDLVRMRPLEDRNVVYNFHFFEPFAFTLQGVGSAAGPSRFLRNVPYPGTPQNVAPLVRDQENDAAKRMLDEYGRRRWDSAAMMERMLPAAKWAKENKVYLTCNEFGAYSVGVPAESRARWVQDAAEALASLRIAWTFRDYVGGFGIAKGAPGNRTLDAKILKGLGVSR